ncbi:hypothetical protein [Clostridium sp. BJN0001]|uniref:hypothetical protein n=1 Tax=Clostridium sp. BJN0001 TaxID=2930219 RepID=UPI001FD38E54|nr:hypothetical protein [Clostridium sp. BJN0001]
MNLHEYLNKYLDITKKLIQNIYAEDKLSNLLKQRKDILDKINMYKLEESQNVDERLKNEILQKDEELSLSLKNHKNNLLNKINSLKKRKQARICYSSSKISSGFFNKKI